MTRDGGFVRLLLLAVLLLAGCKADVPEGILSQREMEEVLYDYHLAQGLAERGNAEAITHEKNWKYNEHYYVKAALAKHGLTQADFDRSLEWYTRHSDLLFDIYKSLSERAAAEAGSAGGGVTTASSSGLSGDTIDVWRGARAYLLSSQSENHFSFEIPADTSLRAGDRLALRLDASWIYREGSKDAFVQLALVYEGDSVVVKGQSIYSSGLQEITQRVGSKRLVAVRGFVYQKVEWSEKPKLLVLTNVSLLRIRDDNGASASSAEAAPAQSDSLSVRQLTPEQRLRDSLHRSDSLRLVQPHFK